LLTIFFFFSLQTNNSKDNFDIFLKQEEIWRSVEMENYEYEMIVWK